MKIRAKKTRFYVKRLEREEGERKKNEGGRGEGIEMRGGLLPHHIILKI